MLAALLTAMLPLAGCTATGAPRDAVTSTVNVPALLDCAREAEVTLLSAHRGGPRPGAPENSLAAIEASLADGALFLELDVITTADDELVLMHDRTLDRTTTGTGELGGRTLAELRTLKLKDADGAVHDAPPPTLAEALASARGRGVPQLDSKGVEPARLVRALREADAIDEVLVITYTEQAALELAALAPELALSVGLSDVASLDRLAAQGLAPARVVAWLGLGSGDAALDAALANRGVETSYGDFRGERRPGHDYAAEAANGAEILSVDDVPAAARALSATDVRARLARRCPAALPGS